MIDFRTEQQLREAESRKEKYEEMRHFSSQNPTGVIKQGGFSQFKWEEISLASRGVGLKIAWVYIVKLKIFGKDAQIILEREEVEG